MPHEEIDQSLGILKNIPSEYVSTLTPNSVRDSLADKSVDLSLIKNFFANEEDFQKVIVVLKTKREANLFSCGICQQQVPHGTHGPHE